MTNREWLNTLSDEEFAEWCRSEDIFGSLNHLYPHLSTVKSNLIEWLKQDKIFTQDIGVIK